MFFIDLSAQGIYHQPFWVGWWGLSCVVSAKFVGVEARVVSRLRDRVGENKRGVSPWRGCGFRWRLYISFGDFSGNASGAHCAIKLFLSFLPDQQQKVTEIGLELAIRVILLTSMLTSNKWSPICAGFGCPFGVWPTYIPRGISLWGAGPMGLGLCEFLVCVGAFQWPNGHIMGVNEVTHKNGT